MQSSLALTQDMIIVLGLTGFIIAMLSKILEGITVVNSG